MICIMSVTGEYHCTFRGLLCSKCEFVRVFVVSPEAVCSNVTTRAGRCNVRTTTIVYKFQLIAARSNFAVHFRRVCFRFVTGHQVATFASLSFYNRDKFYWGLLFSMPTRFRHKQIWAVYFWRGCFPSLRDVCVDVVFCHLMSLMDFFFKVNAS